MSFLEELAARRRFGMKPGLETIRALASRLGDPQLRVPAIHVAGTNGKGAVCAILDAALRADGASVGRYTSPHLVRLNERFFLAGAAVGDDVLDRLSARVSKAAPPETTFFEALTAVAFLLYAEACVDYAILECGLGGRLDATNICAPALTIITKIGLDHCDWLGDTVEKIAAEKAGIIKPGVPIVLAQNEPSVRAVVEARARELGAPFFFAPDLASETELPDDFSLAGAFNRENATTALAALKVLTARPLSAPLLSGFSHVVWPGRFQRVGAFLVDGAHNPPAARALAAALAEEPRVASRTLIFGACADKDVDEVLRILAPHVARGLAVKTLNPRSLAPEELAQRMAACGIPSEPCDSLADALDRARRSASSETLVCGSLFLAGEALVALGAPPTSSVRFDPSEQLMCSCSRLTGNPEFDIIHEQHGKDSKT